MSLGLSPLTLTIAIFAIMLVLMAIRTPIAVAMFVAGHQMDNLGRAVRGQVQLDIAVAVVMHIPAVAEGADGGHGIEQANQIDA